MLNRNGIASRGVRSLCLLAARCSLLPCSPAAVCACCPCAQPPCPARPAGCPASAALAACLPCAPLLQAPLVEVTPRYVQDQVALELGGVGTSWLKSYDEREPHRRLLVYLSMDLRDTHRYPKSSESDYISPIVLRWQRLTSPSKGPEGPVRYLHGRYGA